MNNKRNEIENVQVDANEFKREMTLVYLMFKKETLQKQLASSYSCYQIIEPNGKKIYLDDIQLQNYLIDNSVGHIMTNTPLKILFDEINNNLKYNLNIKNGSFIQLKPLGIQEYSIVLPYQLTNMIQTSYDWNFMKDNQRIELKNLYLEEYKRNLFVIKNIDKLNDKIFEKSLDIQPNDLLDLNSIQLPIAQRYNGLFQEKEYFRENQLKGQIVQTSITIYDKKILKDIFSFIPQTWKMNKIKTENNYLSVLKQPILKGKKFNIKKMYQPEKFNTRCLEISVNDFYFHKINKFEPLSSQKNISLNFKDMFVNIPYIESISLKSLTNHFFKSERKHIEIKKHGLFQNQELFYLENIKGENIKNTHIDIENQSQIIIGGFKIEERNINLNPLFKNYITNSMNIKKCKKINVEMVQDYHMPKGTIFEDIPYVRDVLIKQYSKIKLKKLDFKDIQTEWNQFLKSL